MAEECIFCDIVSGKFGGDFVYEDDAVVAFNDIRPMAPRHVLIVPREHHATLAEVAGDGRGQELLGRMLAVAAKIASGDSTAGEGYRIIINNGPSAGQTVFHLHLHLLWGRHFAWPPG